MATFRSQILEVVTRTDMYFHFSWLFHGGFLFPPEQLQFFGDSALVSVFFNPGFGDVIINQRIAIPHLKLNKRNLKSLSRQKFYNLTIRYKTWTAQVHLNKIPGQSALILSMTILFMLYIKSEKHVKWFRNTMQQLVY